MDFCIGTTNLAVLRLGGNFLQGVTFYAWYNLGGPQF